MARPLTIRNLLDEHRQALSEMAVREYREPDDQAAYLIVDGLRRAGVLTDERSATLTTDSRETEAVA
jgi:hypothetical protein